MHPEPAAEAAATTRIVTLSEIDVGQSGVIREVRTGFASGEEGDIGLRLLELGFIEGERIRVIAHGHPGREPIAVRIGTTTFALRRFEADHVLVAPVEGARP